MLYDFIKVQEAFIGDCDGAENDWQGSAGDYRRWLGVQVLFLEIILVVLFHRK